MLNLYLSLYFVLSRVFVLSKVAEVAWFRWVKMPVSITLAVRVAMVVKIAWFMGDVGLISVKY